MARAPRRPPWPRARVVVVLGVLSLLAGAGSLGAAGAGTSAGPRASVHEPLLGPLYGVAPPSGSGPNPFSMGMPASVAIGQPNLTLGYAGSLPMNLTRPEEMTFDSSGDLFAVDGQNNRVLVFPPTLRTGMNATIAIGQQTLSAHVGGVTNQSTLWEPDGITFDAKGDLWVADTTNNRVLEFVKPFKTGMAASLVLGQATYSTRTPATALSGMRDPVGLAFNASGDLFVADQANNRVLVFEPPFVSGMPATYVIGQTSSTTAGAGTTSKNLSAPSGLAVSRAGDLFVADMANSRVLEFLPPFTTGMAASLVLGEANFTSTNEGLPYGMGAPWDVAFDATGDLWVADAGAQDRVVEYLTPFVANESPAVAIGQTSFIKEVAGTSAMYLEYPRGVAFDALDDLWVSDTGNSRILEFVPEPYTVGFGESGLGSGTTWSVTFDGLTASTNGRSMTFQARNGSYAFSVGSVSGYTRSPASGTVVVNGSSVAVGVGFTPTILGLPPTVFWPVLALVLAVIAVVEAVLLLRRRRRKSEPPAPLTPAAPAEPPKTPG